MSFEIVCVYNARTKGNTPASLAHGLATPFNAPEVVLKMAESLAKDKGFELVNMSPNRKKPQYRLLQGGVLIHSNQYGGGLALFDVVQYLKAQPATTVHADDPDWALESEQQARLDILRMQMEASLSCDCDRANFGGW